jgi:ATP-dependent helicase HrpB
MALSPLPVDAELPALVTALRDAAGAVLVAPPGAGKTTRVPPALLDADLAGGRRVVVLEPRRVAARAAARRMAEERGAPLGDEIGFQVRFDRRAGPLTRILVVTEGILVRMLHDDPFLEDVGAVVFDEFHERSLHTDLSLAMARAAQLAGRPDLKLVVLSATLDPGPVARYLGGCPVLTSAGRSYPVAIEHRPPGDRPLPAAVAATIDELLRRAAGDVLVFLPGVGEIRRCAAALAPLAATHDLLVTPLYGDLGAAEQDAALRPAARRKVVLATNVAETSITIDGVGVVVDSGLARVLRYDPAVGLDRLELGRICQASAAQRAGRAGRQGPGLCVRLYSAAEERALRPTEEPEIRRVDLAAPVLTLRAWGERDPAAFHWLEAPEPAAVARADELLRLLGALDDTRLTPLGTRLARLPLHPRLARLLVIGHEAGHPQDAALCCALLAERDPVRRAPPGTGPRTRSPSDVLDRLDAVEASSGGPAPDDGSLDVEPGAARFLLRAGAQYAALARRELGPAPPPAADRDEVLLRALLAAYPDRVARRRAPGSRRGVMCGGRGVRLADESAVLDAELFVCVDLDAGRRGERAEALCRQASAITRAWLPPGALETSEEVVFAPDEERVVGYRCTRYRDLTIEKRPVEVAAEAAAEALAEAAARDLARALPLDDPEVERLCARVRFVRDAMPELSLPALGEDDLGALLPELCAGRRSFAELRRAPLLDRLRGRLTHAQLTTLEREAPDRLPVPSGSRIRLAYAAGQPPVLAARIQELFGLADTPRIAGGRVPVLVHLLAPNGRPQQVTHDLRSFWTRTYPEVRKELRARYPRHAWPEDPLTAVAARRPRRNR